MLPFLESFSRSIEYILKKHRNILVADGKPGLEPVHIKKQLQEVRKKFNEEGPQVPTIDLDKLANKVRILWANKGYAGLESLSFREKDNLPWIIYHGQAPQIAASAELVNGILTLLRGRWRSSIRKLITIYLRYYDPSLPATDMIRRFIQEHLSTYNGNSPSLQQWRKRTVLLFASAGTKNTALWLRDNGDESALDQLGIKGEAGTGNFLREALCELIKHIANKDFPRGVTNLLPLLELKSQGNRARYPELIAQVANEFLARIDRDCKDLEEELENLFRPFFLRHLGDPRLPGGKIRWRDVKSEARAVFIRWLSRRDLEFFFNIVDQTAGDDKWIYRRRFWEAYLPYIENTWVLLGRDASYLIKTPWMREHMRDRNFGRLTGANSDKSVFLLKIRGYVFIEWSHSGSCRIFREDRCPLEFGQKQCNSTMITGNWPDKKIDHRRSEYYQWQNELAQWIFINLGLRPASSFTLT